MTKKIKKPTICKICEAHFHSCQSYCIGKYGICCLCYSAISERNRVLDKIQQDAIAIFIKTPKGKLIDTMYIVTESMLDSIRLPKMGDKK